MDNDQQQNAVSFDKATAEQFLKIRAAWMDRLLPPRDAAAMLGVTTATLRLWAKAGRIKAIRFGGHHRRYPLSEVQALINKENAERS